MIDIRIQGLGGWGVPVHWNVRLKFASTYNDETLMTCWCAICVSGEWEIQNLMGASILAGRL